MFYKYFLNILKFYFNLGKDLRKSCGGNGFLLHSGIAEIALQSLLPVTAEGDYVLLYLFTSQFLLKAVRHMLNT